MDMAFDFNFSAADSNAIEECSQFLQDKFEEFDFWDDIEINSDSISFPWSEFDDFDAVYAELMEFPTSWIQQNPECDFNCEMNFEIAGEPFSTNAVYANKKLIMAQYYDSEYHFQLGTFSDNKLLLEDIDYEKYNDLGGNPIDEDLL